jgi:transporter family-2 protein
VAIVCSLLVGVLVGFQAPANAALARHVGDIGGAVVSTAISLLVAGVLLLIFGQPGRLGGLAHFRPEYALGGLGGALIALVGLVAVRPLGASAVVALLVASQLLGSVIVDRFGLFGLHVVGLTAGRIVGLLLLAAGTVLVTRT